MIEIAIAVVVVLSLMGAFYIVALLVDNMRNYNSRK